MDLIPIGEAAARLGLSASALRYYDERGLGATAAAAGRSANVWPRRPPPLGVHQDLSLSSASRSTRPPRSSMRPLPNGEKSSANKSIRTRRGDRGRPKGAQQFLTHALHCPTDHPAARMPHDDGSTGPPRRRHERDSVGRGAFRRPAGVGRPPRTLFPRPGHRGPHRSYRTAPTSTYQGHGPITPATTRCRASR